METKLNTLLGNIHTTHSYTKICVLVKECIKCLYKTVNISLKYYYLEIVFLFEHMLSLKFFGATSGSVRVIAVITHWQQTLT